MSIDLEILKQVRSLKQEEISLQPFDKRNSFIDIALVYPSPYKVAMSSLGFQTVYKIFNSIENVSCERSFLPDNTELYHKKKTKLFTIETEKNVCDFDIVAFSIAYETEVLGLIETLELAGIPILSSERNEKYHPLIVAGGPLTFSNPLPLGIFTDIIILGEAEELIIKFIELYKEIGDRKELLKTLSEIDGFYIPSIHQNYLPKIAKCDNELLPAYSQIITPNTELSNMFLIEIERGCSRGCTFCVMRRTTNNGMRIVQPQKIFSKIPENIKKVGLVGAAVSDHPQIIEILEYLVGQNKQIGISSLRADRLNERLVELLSLGGYRTLTVASDGASEKIREQMQKKIKENHLLQCAEYAKQFKMKYLKVYMMIGLPDETDEDIEELIELGQKLSKITKTAMAISPFVSKKNTPLDNQQFENIKSLDVKINKIKKNLSKYIDIRSTSAKWAWIEYKLAQGNYESGFSALNAYRSGGNFSAWKNSFL